MIALTKATSPKDCTHSLLKPKPKPGNGRRNPNDYLILTEQDTIGKFVERIVARKLARNL